MNIATYPKHESYTDCGIDWIGEVPSTWSIELGRQCLYESKEKNIGMKENTVLSLSYGRVIVKDEDKLTGLVPESFETYQVVQPGDIIIRGTDLQNDMTSLRTGLARDTGIITSAYINLRPKADIDPKFLHYLLHSYDVKKVFYALGSGLRQNLSYEDFKYLRLPIPPPQEQRAIAAFLDGKCATIDEAVRIKEEQIRLLTERRQILIQEAVTRGLNPNAPMKDSGIDWIGQIPAHWEKSKLKYVLDTWTGYAFSSAAFCQDGIPILRIGDLIAWGNVSTEKAVCLPEKFASFDEQFGVRKGDILMAMTGGTIGKVSIYDSDQPALLNQRVCAFRPKGVFPLPLALYWMQTKLWDQHILLNSEGGAQPNISDKATIEMPIVLPPSAEERLEIISFLSSSLERIGDAISLKESQITSLREYKTCLINAAVTGKIKVL